MDHFSRLRRNKKDAATPVPIPHKASDVSGKTTPPPGTTPPNVPSRPGSRLSPFRGFHLRSSHKRARDSSPASVPHSPTRMAAPHPESRPTLSRDASATDKMDESGTSAGTPAAPSMPAFLRLNEQQIDTKYHELAWLERNRLLQSMQNPSPDFRWARMREGHPKALDRYYNIQPWANNRVKLQVPEGRVNYVNASPISLDPVPSQDGADDDAKNDRFIAMQGPKQLTVNHVWRMIVEQLEDSGVIVMLTETHESNMEKCFQYFPRRKEDPPIRINRHDEAGDGFLATVRCEDIEETPAGDAIELRKLVIQVLRRPTKLGAGVTDGAQSENGHPEVSTPESAAPDQDLDVKMKSPTLNSTEVSSQPDSNGEESLSMERTPEGGSPQEVEVDGEEEKEKEGVDGDGDEVEERVVWHLLFKEWPDYGVPTLENLDNFFTLMRLSREKNANRESPRVVHCSAGVGRSGTFIALDHLIRELNAGVFENCDEQQQQTTGQTGQTPGADGGDGSDGSEVSSNPAHGEEGYDPIYTTVNRLREQRCTMVQSESQYMFIYQVMRKLWLDKYGRGDETEVGEPAPKRLEVDPFVGGNGTGTHLH